MRPMRLRRIRRRRLRRPEIDPRIPFGLAVSRIVGPVEVERFDDDWAVARHGSRAWVFTRANADALVSSGMPADFRPEVNSARALEVPASPDYGLVLLPADSRPVRAALPGYDPARGPLRYKRPTSLGDAPPRRTRPPLLASPERRVRAAGITELRLAGFTMAAIAGWVGLSRARVAQLDRDGKRVLSAAALGLWESTRIPTTITSTTKEAPMKIVTYNHGNGTHSPLVVTETGGADGDVVTAGVVLPSPGNADGWETSQLHWLQSDVKPGTEAGSYSA